MIPGNYMGAKVGRDCNLSFEVYQWCLLDYSCFKFKVWVIVSASCALEITLKEIGNALICLFNAMISLRNVDSSCCLSSYGRQERASAAMILHLPGR
jgi:hypothetical protein